MRLRCEKYSLCLACQIKINKINKNEKKNLFLLLSHSLKTTETTPYYDLTNHTQNFTSHRYTHMHIAREYTSCYVVWVLLKDCELFFHLHGASCSCSPISYPNYTEKEKPEWVGSPWVTNSLRKFERSTRTTQCAWNTTKVRVWVSAGIHSFPTLFMWNRTKSNRMAFACVNWYKFFMRAGSSDICFLIKHNFQRYSQPLILERQALNV